MVSMQCPKCKLDLEPSGELDVDGEPFVVYQCDQCTRPWEVGGETFDAALTFAVDASGSMIDPETLEPLNLN